MRFLAVLVLGLAVMACGPAGAQTEGAAAPEVEPPPRNSHEMARAVVGAEIGTFVYMDRVRKHKLAPRLAAMPGVGDIFEGTGIEPLRDVDRAYVASKNATDREAVIAVVEHHVKPDKVKGAMQALITKSGSDGAWLDGYPVPAARVSVRGRKSVVLAVNDTILVVTSEAYAKGAAELRTSGGLPDPDGAAAVVSSANNPSETLKARYAPAIPPTIQHGTAEVTLSKDGGAFVTIVGQSTTPEQARADAAELTRNVDEATSVKVSVLRIRMFEPIAFVAEGDQVKGERKVSRAELERLVGLAGMFAGQ
jgi:hypothetical protein